MKAATTVGQGMEARRERVWGTPGFSPTIAESGPHGRLECHGIATPPDGIHEGGQVFPACGIDTQGLFQGGLGQGEVVQVKVGDGEADEGPVVVAIDADGLLIDRDGISVPLLAEAQTRELHAGLQVSGIMTGGGQETRLGGLQAPGLPMFITLRQGIPGMGRRGSQQDGTRKENDFDHRT